MLLLGLTPCAVHCVESLDVVSCSTCCLALACSTITGLRLRSCTETRSTAGAACERVRGCERVNGILLQLLEGLAIGCAIGGSCRALTLDKFKTSSHALELFDFTLSSWTSLPITPNRLLMADTVLARWSSLSETSSPTLGCEMIGATTSLLPAAGKTTVLTTKGPTVEGITLFTVPSPLGLFCYHFS